MACSFGASLEMLPGQTTHSSGRWFSYDHHFLDESPTLLLITVFYGQYFRSIFTLSFVQAGIKGVALVLNSEAQTKSLLETVVRWCGPSSLDDMALQMDSPIPDSIAALLYHLVQIPRENFHLKLPKSQRRLSTMMQALYGGMFLRGLGDGLKLRLGVALSNLDITEHLVESICQSNISTNLVLHADFQVGSSFLGSFTRLLTFANRLEDLSCRCFGKCMSLLTTRCWRPCFKVELRARRSVIWESCMFCQITSFSTWNSCTSFVGEPFNTIHRCSIWWTRNV